MNAVQPPHQLPSILLNQVSVTHRKVHTLNRPLSKTRVQHVRHLIEYIGRDLLPTIINEVNLNGPRPKREPFDTGIFVTAGASKNILINNGSDPFQLFALFCILLPPINRRFFLYNRRGRATRRANRFSRIAIERMLRSIFD